MTSRQQRWNQKNPEVARAASAKYNACRPAISFRPTPEVMGWLQAQRESEESNAALLNRKLAQLMALESQ